VKPSTSKCQIKCDSVKKRRSYRLLNTTAYQFVSIENVQAKNAIAKLDTAVIILWTTLSDGWLNYLSKILYLDRLSHSYSSICTYSRI